MYKETVTRKKVSSIVVIVMLLTVSIVLTDMSRNMRLGQFGSILTILLTAFIFVLILKQIHKCSIKYKYSIIADELIIYKLKGYKEEVMESIKIKDIQSIKKTNRFNLLINMILSKSYSGLNLTREIYACRYKNKHINKKFYFEPSSKLVEKLHLLREGN
ncbi:MULTISPECIES: hypothetical protein [Clostridium]|uniref:Conserved protein, putative n=1 Tax=Clostridium novyi (strain NT) TaxID=386415 RepID=A0Q3N0_CLONN|nr:MULTISPECIES: hypothetical protein [Clostridium]ABK62637.1 conserved protein, putative [Clostridium novyi NT]KEH86626.1 hypothetical protein Z966_02615 [Clostridium novyi A str. NCTC 538]KEH89212.1 hypothetical protein Z967_11325 [Clostridium novyi A str. 4540]KEH90311.1 hypothetical protein Z965_01555 [Clostridium novyi A str. BKT29909]KEH94123.1 hypothetical protein Z963_11635 [Clostridium botulinum C/D str. It1]